MSRDVDLNSPDPYVPEHLCDVPSGIAGVPCALSLPCPVHAPRVFNVGGFVPRPEHGTFTTDAEVAAMARIVKAVEPLDERARKRVVAYVVERYGASWRGVVS